MAMRLISNFVQVTRELEKSLPKQCLRACHAVRNEWVEGLSGQRSGRRYRVPGTSQFYTASAPGEAPAPRLGSHGLRGSIRVQPRIELGRVQARVGTALPYAVYLEYGTENMQPRPSLKPALRRAKPAIKRIFDEGPI